MSSEVVVPEVRTLRPGWTRWALALPAAALSMVALAFVAGGGYVALGGGAAVAWYISRDRRRPSRTRAPARVTPEGLFLGSKMLAARRRIRSALVSPRGAEGEALVTLSRGPMAAPIELVVGSVLEGRRLASALGLGAAQQATELPLAAISVDSLKSRIRGTWVGAIGLVTAIVCFAMAGAGLTGTATLLVGALSALAHLASMVRLLTRGTIAIGADAVRVSWLSRRLTIPIADIECAVALEGAMRMSAIPALVRIHKKDGTFIDLVGDVGRPRGIRGYDGGPLMHAKTIAERIDEAVAARALAAPTIAYAAEEGALERGSRSTEDWVAALRRLNDGEAGFRDHGAAGTVLERLLAILEDVTARPTRRAAAAVALAPHLDDERRERIRIAAQATATPKLRVALEAAASQEEDKLVRALEDVATDEARDVEHAQERSLSGGRRDPAGTATIQ